MNRDFINSLETFKAHMLSWTMPNHVVRYCSSLDDESWVWFYQQMIEPVLIVKDLDYLFYILKWILKEDSNDFTFSVYVQDWMDPEGIGHSFKDEWYPILNARYEERMRDFFIEQYTAHN